MPDILLKFAAVAVMLLAGCSDQRPLVADERAEIEARSIAIADLFQNSLQTTLAGALANGDAVSAIDVCAGSAPSIAAEVSAETGAEVRRISLGPRNPAAATSNALLLRLEALVQSPLDTAGQPAVVHWTEGQGEEVTHNTLRAVVMRDQPCRTCHGAAISGDVRAAIAERYPQDRATGFHAGELRGAVLVSWLLNQNSQPGVHK